MKSTKRKLEHHEVEECLALKAALDSFNSSRSKKISQQQIADDLDITQGAVSSFLNARNVIPMSVAVYFSNQLGIPIDKFSPRLAKDAKQIADLVNKYQQTQPPGLYQSNQDEFDALLNLATPRTRIELVKIAQAAADGRLTDDDIALLTQIADRLTKKE